MDWHHPHNLDLLGGCYQHQGRLKTADRYLLEAVAFPAVTETSHRTAETLGKRDR